MEPKLNSFLARGYFKICKNYQLILITILIILILPFLFVSFFNVPITDDFSFGKWGQNANTLETLKKLYFTENGRYFSLYFLITANPLVYNIFYLFAFTPILLILLLFLSIYFFLKQITQNIPFKILLVLTLCLFYTFIVSMPSTSEGLFWFTGSYTHTFPFAVCLIIAGLFKKMSNNNSTQKKYLFFSLILFLQFIVIGCQEIVLLTYTSILCLYTINCFIFKSKHRNAILLLLIFAILFSCLELFAPGNVARMEATKSEHRANLLYCSYGSFVHFLKHIPNFITITLVPIFSILLFNISIQYNKNINLLSVNPFLGLIFSAMILYSLFLPGTYSMVGTYPRMLNDIYFVFLIFWFYNIVNISIWLKRNKILQNTKGFNLYYFSPILIFYIVVYSFSIHSNFRKVLSDIKSKRIFLYHSSVSKRFEMLQKNKGAKYLEVIKIQSLPSSINLFDVHSDPNNSENIGYKLFYEIKILKGIPSK